MFITDDIRYVGVNDHNIDLFEGQYVVENGMAYNSYVIMDEQIAVMDTVDGNFTDEWLKNISDVIGDRKPSYLIVQHMEPDHSGNIDTFCQRCQLSGSLQGCQSCRYSQGFCDDEAILWHRLPGETDCCQGRRYAFSWYTHTDICSCTNGSLAGSYGDLRQQG